MTPEEYIKSSKEIYRKDAQKLTWEEKVESIELMREASKIAKESMSKTIDEPNSN